MNLDQLVTNAKSLDQEQQTLTGRLREITRLRKEAEQNSHDLRSRVAAQLRGKLGFKNENLIAYGITPRKRARKKPTKPAPPPLEVTQEPPPHSAIQGAAPAEPAKPQ